MPPQKYLPVSTVMGDQGFPKLLVLLSRLPQRCSLGRGVYQGLSPSIKQLLIRRESMDRETHGAAISNVPGLCTYQPSMHPTVWKSFPAVLELCPTWSGTKIQVQNI